MTSSNKLPNRPTCPECGASLDGYAEVVVEGRSPRPGDFTVCAYCTRVLVFTEETELRLITAEEIAELDGEVAVSLLMAKAAATKVLMMRQKERAEKN